jgi:hypothetical protein
VFSLICYTPVIRRLARIKENFSPPIFVYYFSALLLQGSLYRH